MDRVFLYILYFTLVLAGLLLFKGLFRNRLSARIQLWLWVVLFLYLLIPVMPESPASVYNLLPNEAPAFSVAEPTPDSSTPYVTEPVLTPPTAIDHHDMIQDLIDESMPYLLLGGVWLMGVLLFGGYFVAVYLHCLRKVGQLPTVTDPDTLSVFEGAQTRLGIRRRVRLLSGGDTPMLIGIFRPRILLPDGYRIEEQEAVLTHELCHLKHGDLALLWAALVLLILNWYNPLAWVANTVFRRDVELYCDQRVLKQLNNKKEYANLLLRTALRKNRFVAGTTALQNGEKEVSRRIRYLATFKKPGVCGGSCILVLGIVLGVLLLTNANKSYNMDSTRLGDYATAAPPEYMADIAYADGDIAVFYWQDGLFVYDVNEDRITQALDLAKLHVVPQEWDGARLLVTVSADGKTALLVNENAERLTELSNYRVNLINGRVRKTRDTTPDSPFEGRVDFYIESGRFDPNARYSASMIDTKSGYWYLIYDGTRRGEIMLCRLQNGVVSTVYPFGNLNTSVVPDLPYASEEYQKIMAEFNIISNASYHWTFSVDSAYEFSEVQYLANYATGGEVDLHDTLTKMGVNPSDYYGKAVYVRVDVVESDDGSGIPHFALILPETGEVLAHQLLTAEQEEQLKWTCIYAEKLHPKGGALEPISALYTLTKYKLDNHFRITNEHGYVYRSLNIRDWVEAGSWSMMGGSERRANFTLELHYEKEEDNADSPLTAEYEMSVRCNGQTVRLLRKYGDDWYPLDLEQFYPVRTILAQSSMMPN